MRDLFFNVPARRKFLRSLATESAHVTEVAEAAALAIPGLTLVLAREGRVVREWLRVTTREDRVRAAFGDEELSACRGERGPLRVEAFLSRPERARAAASALTLLRQRSRDPRSRSSCDRLPRPMAACSNRVAIRSAWCTSRLIPPSSMSTFIRKRPRCASPTAVRRARLSFASSPTSWRAVPGCRWPPELEPSQARRTSRVPAAAVGASPGEHFRILCCRGSRAALELLDERANAASGRRASALMPTRAPTRSSGVRWPPRTRRSRASTFVAQVKQTYLICEGGDGLYVIDQHAAAERVTFDRLRKAYAGHEIATQALLFPAPVEVTARDAAFVEEEQDALASLGLDVRAIGPTTVAVHAMPRLLDTGETGERRSRPHRGGDPQWRESLFQRGRSHARHHGVPRIGPRGRQALGLRGERALGRAGSSRFRGALSTRSPYRHQDRVGRIGAQGWKAMTSI